MKILVAIFVVLSAGIAVAAGWTQVNVAQEHNHLSPDGLYIDSAFTRRVAANLRRDHKLQRHDFGQRLRTNRATLRTAPAVPR